MINIYANVNDTRVAALIGKPEGRKWYPLKYIITITMRRGLVQT